MVTTGIYAKFYCKICGETVYSPVLDEQDTAQKGGTLELTCSSGHTDQYNRSQVVLVPSRPAVNLRLRYAAALGG